MANNYEKNIGKVLCKGSGIKAYFELTLTRQKSGGNIGEVEFKTFRYEVGNLVSLQTATSRQTSLNYVAGSSIAKSVNKGIRTCYGQAVFSQLDQGMLYNMFRDINKWNADTQQLEYASLDSFGFHEYTLADPGQALSGGPTDQLTIEYFKDDTFHLDSLPPVDIIIVGAADDIDPMTGTYEVNNTYMFKAKKVTFMSDTFGISAGAPLHDVSTQILVLGGIEPWRKIN